MWKTSWQWWDRGLSLRDRWRGDTVEFSGHLQRRDFNFRLWLQRSWSVKCQYNKHHLHRVWMIVQHVNSATDTWELIWPQVWIDSVEYLRGAGAWQLPRQVRDWHPAATHSQHLTTVSHWRSLAEGPSPPQFGPSQAAVCRAGDCTSPLTHLAPAELWLLPSASLCGRLPSSSESVAFSAETKAEFSHQTDSSPLRV